MDESNLTEVSLLTDNRDALCEELGKFMVEIRKTDKTQYPPRSIQLILCGLQQYIRQERPQTPVNFTSHCHLHHSLHLKLIPSKNKRGIDINELFAFELQVTFRPLSSIIIHV